MQRSVHGTPIVPVSDGRVDLSKVIPAECRDSTRILSRLDPREAASLTGLPLHEAELAVVRLYDEAIYTPNPRCRRLIEERAAALGYTVLSGKKFIHVSASQGKARGVLRLERLVGEPALRISSATHP